MHISLKVTAVPKQENIELNSIPIAPPPITSMFLGISVKFSASVEVINFLWSNSMLEIVLQVEPVAIIILFETISMLPSSVLTESALLLLKLATPFITSTLFDFRSFNIPLDRFSINLFFLVMMS